MIKILCITGWCRNGSTIIGNVLNEIPGFFHVGELHFLWKNSIGVGANSSCGCGQALTACPVWSEVLTAGRAPDADARAHAETVIRRQQSQVRTRHTWRVLRRGLHGEEIREHAALMDQTYRAVAKIMDAEVIVDTTKIPGEAALLPHLDAMRTYFVHLVRDPRAVAQSWSVEKDYCYIMSPAKSTAYWRGFNWASKALTRRHPDRSMFLRYEDFIADPPGTIDLLLEHVGADDRENPMRGRMIELGTNHTVTGNPDRFRTGGTLIRETDDTWRRALPVSGRLAAMALSWPMSWRYGYGWAI